MKTISFFIVALCAQQEYQVLWKENLLQSVIFQSPRYFAFHKHLLSIIMIMTSFT